jgi:FlaG protein
MVESINADVAVQVSGGVSAEKGRVSTPGPKTAAPVAAPKVETLDHAITLSVDDLTHEVIALVRDRATNKVIGEIPAEEMRTAAKVIRAIVGQNVDKVI